jgi:hypothetical protein
VLIVESFRGASQWRPAKANVFGFSDGPARRPPLRWEQNRLPLAPHAHHVVAPAQARCSSCPARPIWLLIARRFNQQALIDTTPLPDDIPKVKELGASSAPLLSASFFIGDRCKAYNDDYMMCKTEANGRGELECMKEGRKVTRCAASVYACPRKVISRTLTPAGSRTSTTTASTSSAPTGSALRTTTSSSGTAGPRSGG